jgi:hypothetical protein
VDALEFDDAPAAIRQADLWQRQGIACLLLQSGDTLLLVTREEYDYRRRTDNRIGRLPILEVFRAAI